MRELHPGDIIFVDDMQYKIAEWALLSCIGCFFYEKNRNCPVVRCRFDEREDEKSIIIKPITRSVECFYKQGQLCFEKEETKICDKLCKYFGVY